MKRFALATVAVAALRVPSFAAEPEPVPAPAPAPVAAPEPPKTPAPKPFGGFKIQSDDKAYALKLGGQLQVDAWGFVGDDAKAYTDEVRIRRARLNVRATVAKYYDLRLLVDFAGSAVQLLDAVFETTWLEEFRIRIGKEKQPVGWDRLQSDTATAFLEKSQASTLVPNRDLGLQIVGKIGGGLLDYQIGLWDGAADGATNEVDNDDNWDFAGRLTFQPFLKADIPALKELLIGVYGSFGDVHGTATATQLTNYRSSGRAQWFRWAAAPTDPAGPPAIAEGARVRLGGHLNWQYGPVSVFGEYVQSSQDVTFGAVSDTVSNSAYVAQATWLLTGDDASWNGVKPKTEFDPTSDAGGPGGIELAVRWSALSIDDAAFDNGFASANNSAKGISALTIGLNWYLNSYVKLQLDWEQTTFDGGAADGKDRPTENLVGARGQFLF